MAHLPPVNSNLGPSSLTSHEAIKESETPLHLAAEQGKIEAVIKLLEAGAELDVVNNEGFLAKDIAWLNGHKDISNLLIKVEKSGRSAIRIPTCPEQDLYWFYYIDFRREYGKDPWPRKKPIKWHV